MKPFNSSKFGPWAVVTGASSGIGTAFSRVLARHGFNLVLAARRGDVLEALGTELQRAHGIECRAVALDLTSPTFLATLRQATDALDVGLVISNAGRATATELVSWEMEALEHDVAVNVTAHAKLAHHFAGRLVQRGEGGILLVSSIAGNQPIPYLASYAASKSFVTIFGQSLHHELRPRGVTVTVLVPGPTDTPMRTEMGFGRSRLRPMTPEACALAGLSALARGKAKHIPGARTRLLLGVMPRGVITRVLGRMTSRFARASLPARAAVSHLAAHPADSSSEKSIAAKEILT